jgi:hypothetical protein
VVLGAAFQDFFDKRVSVLKNSVIPLIGSADEGPYVAGSAVLIRVGCRAFMLTAQHVLDEQNYTTLYYFGLEGGQTPLVGEFSQDRKFDIAACELSSEQLHWLSRYPFLNGRNVRLKPQRAEKTYAAAVGYPDKKARIDFGVIRAEPYSISNIVSSDRGGRIVIPFDKSKVTFAKMRKQITAPDTYGMSGGAIFSLPVRLSEMSRQNPAMLAGIATHWRFQNRRAIEGTAIEVVLNFLKDAFSAK